jgi:hypothetical protein
MILSALAVSTVVFATGGVGGRPANPDPDNPRTQSIFIFTLDRGVVKSDQLYLSNNDDADQVVDLYAVDGTVSNTGAFTCKQAVEPRDDMGKAIKLSKSEVTVPSNGSLLVDFTVTMPAKADVGEHDGCIVVQKKENITQQTGSIQVHTRTAIRVVATVPGDIHRSVTVSDFNVGQRIKESEVKYHLSQSIASGGTLSIEFGLKNNGNVSADVDTHVYVRDLFGNEVARNGGQYAVIADTTFGVNYDSDFHPFFGGWYKVKADIAYNKKAGTFGVSTSGDLLRSESPESIVFFWPSVWLFVIMGLIAASVTGYFVWRMMQKREARRRAYHSLRRPTEKAMWGPYEVKRGDTLQELARKSGVPINKVALMNRLESPYVLEPGQKIYLPRKKHR